jgi:hypothetical protein
MRSLNVAYSEYSNLKITILLKTVIYSHIYIYIYIYMHHGHVYSSRDKQYSNVKYNDLIHLIKNKMSSSVISINGPESMAPDYTFMCETKLGSI